MIQDCSTLRCDPMVHFSIVHSEPQHISFGTCHRQLPTITKNGRVPQHSFYGVYIVPHCTAPRARVWDRTFTRSLTNFIICGTVRFQRRDGLGFGIRNVYKYSKPILVLFKLTSIFYMYVAYLYHGWYVTYDNTRELNTRNTYFPYI
jgi:hypothetical protein